MLNGISENRRNGGYTSFQELDEVLPLISIQCELPLQEIYENVKFHER